jgi:hypothetical protein
LTHFEREEERATAPFPPRDDDDRADARQASSTNGITTDWPGGARQSSSSPTRGRTAVVDPVRERLRPLIVDKDVTVWDESYISAGPSWEAAIHDAILRARVAILIVSRHFLASSYVSCWPAKGAVGKSSAVALDRTA